MPKVTDAHRKARRDEILAAAHRVFARRGFRGASIPMIIQESGLSVGAIYSYFEGKDALFLAVVEGAVDVKTAQIVSEPGDAPRPPGELVRVVLGTMQGEPILDIAPQIWAEAVVDEDIRSVLSQGLERLTNVLRIEASAWAAAHPERTGPDPDAWAERVVPVLFSAIPGFVLQRRMSDAFDEQAYLDSLVEAFPH